MGWDQLVAQFPFMGNEYVQAALILLLVAAIARLFQGVVVGLFRSLTAKTETDIDDIIIDIASKPLFAIIVAGGFYYALRTLSELEPYFAVVNGVFFVVIVLLLSWMGSRIFSLLTGRWFAKHRDLKGSPKLLNIIAAVIIYIIALILVLDHFDVAITPFIAALGVGGLAVGLALQDTLGNIFAGLHIISDQPIRVHDIIEVKSEGITGTVEDIGWRSTRIKTFTNNLIIVPNAKLANSVITNFEFPEQPMRAVVECGVDYGSDLKKVEKVALEVAKKMQQKPYADKKWEPLLFFHTFADSNINFRVILQAKTRGDTFKIIHDYMMELHAAFAKKGIEISWPVRKVYSMK